MKNQFKKRWCTECNAYTTTASILKGLKKWMRLVKTSEQTSMEMECKFWGLKN